MILYCFHLFIFFFIGNSSIYIGPNTNEIQNGSSLYPFTDLPDGLNKFFQNDDQNILILPNDTPYNCTQSYIFDRNISMK